MGLRHGPNSYGRQQWGILHNGGNPDAEMCIRDRVSTDAAVEAAVSNADLVIGCVLIPGKAAPKLMKKEYLKHMKPGSVIVELLKEIPEKVQYVIVSESGASVYSASKLATEEFPNFDVGQRSAASVSYTHLTQKIL